MPHTGAPADPRTSLSPVPEWYDFVGNRGESARHERVSVDRANILWSAEGRLCGIPPTHTFGVNLPSTEFGGDIPTIHFVSLREKNYTMRKHIICPLRDGKLTPTDHTFDFRKWIGRPLSKHERQLINTLERIRRKRKIRVHITDRPGVNSTSILISYIQYLQTIYPRQPCAVYAGTKKEAQLIAKTLPGETFPCSVKRPFNIRGCNYDMALVLNPPQKYIDNILRTIIPAVYDRAGCAIIILTASPLVLNRRAMKRNQVALPPAYYEQFDDPNPPPDLPTEHTVIVDLTDHTIIPLAETDDGDQNDESFALLS